MKCNKLLCDTICARKMGAQRTKRAVVPIGLGEGFMEEVIKTGT